MKPSKQRNQKYFNLLKKYSNCLQRRRFDLEGGRKLVGNRPPGGSKIEKFGSVRNRSRTVLDVSGDHRGVIWEPLTLALTSPLGALAIPSKSWSRWGFFCLRWRCFVWSRWRCFFVLVDVGFLFTLTLTLFVTLPLTFFLDVDGDVAFFCWSWCRRCFLLEVDVDFVVNVDVDGSFLRWQSFFLDVDVSVFFTLTLAFNFCVGVDVDVGVALTLVLTFFWRRRWRSF